MSKLLLTKIAVFYSWLTAWPAVILFVFSSNKDLIEEDARRNMSYRKAKISGVNSFIYLFVVDKYFRTLFYSRIGYISFLISWIWHRSNVFFPICSNIGGGFYLAHPFSTILNARKIGKNFTCRQNTTIGNKSDSDKESKPVIGDNVSVGANVVIIGNISIGDNVIIGAGSVVVKDVPSNAIVVGNPAKIIKFV